MKKVTKSIKSVIIIMIIFIFLIGCSKNREEEKGVVILRWVTDPNPVRKEQIKLFEKMNPKIKIKMDWQNADMRKILTQIAGGNPPDLFDIHGTKEVFNIFAHKGVLLDITEYCKKYNIKVSDFWPQCKEKMVYKGRIYALPANAANIVLFYNKTYFDEMGLKYPTSSWTWEDLLKTAKKLTKIEKNKRRRYGFYWPEGWENVFIWEAGGREFTKDGKKCVINSKAAKKGIRFLYDMIYKYHVMPSQSDLDSLATEKGWGGGSIGLFCAGSVAMIGMGRWGIVKFREIKDFKWDIAEIPVFKGRKRVTLFFTRTTAISKMCKHPEAAFKFLKFLTTKEYNRTVIESGDSLPAVISIAKSKLFLYDPKYPFEKHNYIYLKAMKYARNKETSPYISDFDVKRIEEEEYDLMWGGVQTPEKTLDNIAKRINKIIEKNLNK